ncbi:hypothetical protein UFOVP1470_32 [uncultured Caudovirales phage]|uniref:Uncharacterized protein n=1 Tax=uncultured Caudovirales phage TaxID=2100421 RepID=A0A6J5PLD2_9CAUD|nr:hypothetical protein UFOVP939_46 [uncultured Caudovirales phage]CAB4178574.1 hypothetical protein UFOVP1018_30 [uncultured Caudovirales phage]CAB4184105.1 hypothetical protein UFOVP1105_31 [uncultured Caudovirales phage]CAB4202555.1 hypothetical protein UFOVP1372_21 [uncultured Caudovirales phage]CAB4215029.1 hypothetical protein UFOVP1470_32 [uncultured Caudovirales phage]
MLKLSGLILQFTGWAFAHLKLIATTLSALLLSAWAWHWYTQLPQATVGVSVPAAAAPEVKRLPVIEIEIKKPVKVYSGGEKTKKKLDLPDVIVMDVSQSVLASTKVQADDHSHTVTTVINSETGKTETFDRRDPLPWIAFTTKGDVMLSAGLNMSGDQVGMVQARQGILRIKSVTLGVVGQSSVTNGGAGGFMDNSAMAAVWYGWGK